MSHGTTTEQPHYLGHRSRLKERFHTDPASIPEYEFLELLLGYGLPRRDTKPLAKALLSRFGSLGAVLTAPASQLSDIPGMGRGLILFLNVVRESSIRAAACGLPNRQVMSDPEAVARLAQPRLERLPREEFWIMLVDNRNRLIDFIRIGTGTVDQAAVFPREVAALALERHASGIVLVHNHPGGDPSPSRQDRELTRRICKAVATLDVRVLDHLVVSDSGWFSFQAEGLMA